MFYTGTFTPTQELTDDMTHNHGLFGINCPLSAVSGLMLLLSEASRMVFWFWFFLFIVVWNHVVKLESCLLHRFAEFQSLF